MEIKNWHWGKLIVCWVVGLFVFVVWGSVVATALLPAGFDGIGIPDPASDWFLGSVVKSLVLGPLIVLLTITWKWSRRR